MTNIARSTPQPGTAKYTPPPSTGQRDIFGLANPAARENQQGPVGSARFELTGSNRERNVVGWRVTIYDLRGGLNQARGSFATTHARSSLSTMDTRYAGYATLPLMVTAQTSPDPVKTNFGPLQLSSLNIFGRLVLAAGGQPNACLFKETSAADPTLIALSYDFNDGATNHDIYGLASVAISGQGPRLCVYGAKASEILSDIDTSPTVAGTISTLTSTFGVIQTPLSEQPILFNEYKSIRVLNAASAYGDAKVHTIDVPGAGGYVVGLSALAGGRLRVFWVFPRGGNGFGMLALGSEEPGDLYSTDLEGYDLAKHELPLRYVIGACIWRDGILAHDGRRIVFTNGRMLRDLRLFADRVQSSDRELRIRGFTVNGPELIVRVNEIAVSGTSGATVEWEESYDFDLDAWTNLTKHTTLSTTGVQGLNAPGADPISFSTGYRHHYTDGSWRRSLTVPYGSNPFNLRKTSGATAGTGQQFDSPGVWTSPKWSLPGLEGAPFIVSRVRFGGDVDAGGSDAAVEVAIASNTGAFGSTVAHYVTTHPQWRQSTSFDVGSAQMLYELQVQVTAAQQTAGTDPTRFTPNCLPIVIEGYSFIDAREMPGYRTDRTR